MSTAGRIATWRGWLPNAGPSNRVAFDLIVILGLATLVRLATLDLDLFERLHDFTRAHENAEFDEMVVTVFIASLAFIVFGLRRMQDQRGELRLRIAAEERATMLALQDPLTGLPNRRRFHEVLSARTASHARDALFLLDLDGFKQLNDVFGHAAGDEALQTIAKRMRSFGDGRCTSARLGGDEFTLLARDVGDIGEAERIARQLIETISAPIDAAGVSHRLTVSIGIAMLDGDTDLPSEYLRRADVALYRAKREYGSTFAAHDKAMDEGLKDRIALEHDLREALAARQIVPKYQPIVDLKTNEIVSFEALARWSHPTRGDIAPSIFVPLAEDRGFIVELTEAIIERACRDALTWPGSVVLSVNLSPLLFHSKSFGLRLAKILAETHFPASRLEVEVTERALEGDLEDARAFLRSLRSLGVRIALDDFGTGYSSLSRLRELPFDEIKIDRRFVQCMGDSTDKTLFVRTIMQLGNGLGMTVTAEGVEDAEQRRMLIAEGCPRGQGFLFSAAVPSDQVHQLLRQRERAAAL